MLFENIDFMAWKEDRAELKRLRAQALSQHDQDVRVASLLRSDARRIHQACDELDSMAAQLGQTGQE